MPKKEFPDGSSGMVHGPDGPTRRTRAHVINGYVEPVEWEPGSFGGRGQAWMDEEGAWLKAHFIEE